MSSGFTGAGTNDTIVVVIGGKLWMVPLNPSWTVSPL